MFYPSFTNPTKDEAFIGILTCPNLQVTHFNDEGEVESVETQQMVSIGLIIFRIDIIW